MMFLVLGKPLSLLLLALQNWLAGLSGSSAIILGAVLGLMMRFDLGGPVNKAAYLFATAGLSTSELDRLACSAWRNFCALCNIPSVDIPLSFTH
ncbi:hypothetical protein [Corynebacterium rouxii]|uniref:Uncharacterized protein n=1 Tax=Corynebacterium rouxii TaxID=2719119 RepID=A0ABU3PN11_9CORY|nr:hypothetical protein [Corynebacterium rouxii]MDT9409030.1 hypothetical protein [Corynebacterium rouxii]MDT9411211.1 hypothetical protein [Corynebacterium rouxii]